MECKADNVAVDQKTYEQGANYANNERAIYGTEVLGSFSIIRGFATLQELARISVPVLMDAPAVDGAVTGHQRPIDEVHAEEVKKYFEQGQQRFVPEIILALRVPLTPEMLTPAGNFAPQQIGVRYNGGGIELRRKHKGKTLQNHVLKIRTASLPRIQEQQRIRRIDGNHRLAKAEELMPCGRGHAVRTGSAAVTCYICIAGSATHDHPRPRGETEQRPVA